MVRPNSLEDFILDIEIPTFVNFFKSTSPSQRELMVKVILALLLANLNSKDFILSNNNLPLITYLSHNGTIEVSFTNPEFLYWFGQDEFTLSLEEYKLPIIKGKISSNTIKITIEKSALSWQKLRDLCTYIEVFNIPSQLDSINLTGQLNNITIQSLSTIDPNIISSEICLLPPCRGVVEFQKKCNLYNVINPSI
jgi:hypothetical protein